MGRKPKNRISKSENRTNGETEPATTEPRTTSDAATGGAGLVDENQTESPNLNVKVENNPPEVIAAQTERKERKSHKRQEVKKEAEVQQTAFLILICASGLASMSFGDECAMTGAEREMMGGPLARILARASPGMTEAIDRYIDPLMLAFGFMAWGARVYRIQADRADDENNNRPPEPEPQPPAPSGFEIPAVTTQPRGRGDGLPDAVKLAESYVSQLSGGGV